jgi:hypothetical protein
VRVRVDGVRYEMQEGVTQQPADSEADEDAEDGGRQQTRGGLAATDAQQRAKRTVRRGLQVALRALSQCLRSDGGGRRLHRNRRKRNMKGMRLITCRRDAERTAERSMSGRSKAE